MSEPNRIEPLPEDGRTDEKNTPRTEPEVRDFIRTLVLELAPAGRQDATETSRLGEDLGYHSLALMELAFALEDEFDLHPIDEQTARRIVTVRDVATHVVTELAAGGRLLVPSA